MDKKVVPYLNSTKAKKQQVELMFDNIAARYDLLNAILSFGIFKLWQHKLVKEAVAIKPKHILDVATGTGGVAFELAKKNIESVTGADLSEQMLNVARAKLLSKSFSTQIDFVKADAEKLPFDDNSFDAVTVAYGVRNFENLDTGLKELYRVLKPNGKLCVLEFSTPTSKPVQIIFGFYFNKICPLIGRFLTGDSNAYTYLPQSVKVFPYGSSFTNILVTHGFKNTSCKSLTFGIASIYTASK